MKIAIRTKDGWEIKENKKKYVCDRCGERLWVNPGGGIYCNGNWKECVKKLKIK